MFFFFFSSRRRHTRLTCDWSSDVCSSDLLGAAPAVLLGAITGVGGGTLRDVLLGQIPSVLRRGLYAIPALLAAGITVAALRGGGYGVPAALGAALACFAVRMLGVRYDLNAPMPPGRPPPELPPAAPPESEPDPPEPGRPLSPRDRGGPA